jgi:hypothetical protein
MEPKEKMHSESQNEIENSVNTTENMEKNTPGTAGNEKEVVDEGLEIEPVDNERLEEELKLGVKKADEAATEPEEEEVKTEVKSEAEVDKVEESVQKTEVADAEEAVAETKEVKSETEVDIVEESVQETEVADAVEAVTEIKEVKADSEVDKVDESVQETEDVEVKAEKAEEKIAEINEEHGADKIEEVKAEPKKDEPAHEKDYSKLSELELINEFRELLQNKNFLEIQQNVDAIKINFYKKHKAQVQEEKKKFLDEGGYEEEFKPEPNPYEQDLKNLIADYRQMKLKYNRELESEKEENVKIKYEIIEEIKGLVNRKESINKTFQEFKELQQKWRDVGLVPQANMKDLWENYHHHVENFYDYIKINKELRDLDLKRNMDEKIVLCERAEALLLEPSILKAFNQLQKLHDAWREIGPVPHDKKEELWERFKDTTTKINKKHQDFFDDRKKMQKKNLEAKTALCEKVEEITMLEIKNHKEWEAKSKEIIEIQKYWRTIGFAPKKENNSIYERFRNGCDSFFDKKREFYSKHKEIQTNNLQLKIDLCVQAEALKESTDWKKTTEEYIAIQKKWKEIGPVPRKHSDIVWKRFRAACDYFFNKKSAFFSTIDDSQVENLNLKNQLVEEVKAFKLTGNDKADFDVLRDFQRRWTEIGHVPIAKKNDVQKSFRDSINALFDKLRVDDKDRNLLKYRTKVTDLKSSARGQNRVFAERDKFVSKLKQLENDLITLKNNIGFFANSKNAESLIKDVEKKITNSEDQIEYLKDKIRIIDEAESNED